MTITVTPIQNNQTFGAWLSTTNRLANIISQNTVTADTSLGGSVTTGNVFVNGHFGASYLYAENALIGGNVSSNGTLNLAANAAFKYASSNIAIVTANSTSTNVAISAENTAILSNTLYITASVNAIGVVAIANTLSVANAATFNDVINVEDIIPSVNAAFDLGSTTNLFDGAFVKTVNFEAGSANSTIYTGTANNSNNLNNQPASFYTNATNITTGTLATARLPATINATTINITTANIVTLTANNSNGTLGQILLSNGTGIYWGAPESFVTSVGSGSGLTGGPITSSGSLSILANTGIDANATGVYVNSAYIGTLTANNATNFDGQPASYYTNATNLTTGTVPTARLPATINATTINITTANIVTLTANNSNGTLGQVLTSNGTGIYWGAGGGVSSVATGNGLTGGTITTTGTVSVRANTGIIANATGVYVNSAYIGTLTANNANNLNNQPASFYTNATNITSGTLATARLPATINTTTINVTTANIVTLTANNSNGTLGQILTSNGTGIYWGAPTIPSGTTTQVQFNNSGAFGSSASFTYNPTTITLTVSNTIVANGFIRVGANVVASTDRLLIGNASVNTVITAGTISLNGINFESTMNSGFVVNRVSNSYTSSVPLTTVIPFDDTIPTFTEGTQILNCAFTPRDVANKIRIRAQATGSTNTGGQWSMVLIDSADPANQVARAATGVSPSNPNEMHTCVLEFIHNTAAAQNQQINYSIMVGPASLSSSLRINGSSSRVYGGVMAATMTVEEILQ
jgi:hypothetical protein